MSGQISTALINLCSSNKYLVAAVIYHFSLQRCQLYIRHFLQIRALLFFIELNIFILTLICTSRTFEHRTASTTQPSHTQHPDTLQDQEESLKKPTRSGSKYYNYKGFYTHVLLALVELDYRFLWVAVGSCGSSSDVQILTMAG